MSTALRPNNKVDMLTNVPIRMSIKYIDVYPDSGKGYGASMRLKGTIDGAEAIVYPKGKVWAAVKALKAAGVIDAGGEYEDEPVEKYSIPVKQADVEIVMKQGPGEKYASFTVNGGGNAAPASPNPRAVAKTPQSIGPALPWEQDVDDTFARAETGAPPAAAAPDAKWNEMLSLYDRCVTKAMAFCTTLKITDQQAVVAMTATLFIEANKRGIK